MDLKNIFTIFYKFFLKFFFINVKNNALDQKD